MEWFPYGKNLRRERVKKTQSNYKLLWKIMSSRYFHHGMKLFIEGNCPNNIHPVENIFFAAANFEGF